MSLLSANTESMLGPKCKGEIMILDSRQPLLSMGCGSACQQGGVQRDEEGLRTLLWEVKGGCSSL